MYEQLHLPLHRVSGLMITTSLPRTVTICLTESCNLNCVYCYEKNKSSSVITFEKVKQIIEEEFSKSKCCEKVIFELFGGEPFLQFGLIKEIVEFLKTNNWDMPYVVSITTNGTLVHGEIQDWLIQNREILNVGLSLDGTKSMHDANRSNSFELIDIPFFANFSENPRVKMTISEKTLNSLAEGVIYLHNCGFIIDCNLAYGIQWHEQRFLKVLHDQLLLLIDFYIKNPKIHPCSMLSSHIEVVNVPPTNTSTKWCGTGKYMVAYDINKNPYPCQFFMPVSMDTPDELDIEIPDNIPMELLPKMCRTCPCVNICPTCYGSNYNETGNPYQKSVDYCSMMKIIFLANSYFKWLQLSSDSFEFTKEERIVYLRSIEIIQNYLRNDPILQMTE